MEIGKLPRRLAEAQATIQALQHELAETNRGLVALSMELEQRVEERTAELAKSNGALRSEIAQRKQAEASLRRGEEQLELLCRRDERLRLRHPGSSGPDYGLERRRFAHLGLRSG